MAVKRSEVIKELQDLSTQISYQVRTIAVGLLALSWGLIVGNAPAQLQIAENVRSGLLRVGLAAILALVLDFIQYLAGYVNSLEILRAAERAHPQRDDVQYDTRAFFYQLRDWMFWLKILVTIGATAYLFYLLIPRVV